MDNREGTIIGIGALAIAALSYFYSRYRLENLQYKRRQRQLEEVKVINSAAQLSKLKDGQKHLVFVQQAKFKFVDGQNPFKRVERIIIQTYQQDKNNHEYFLQNQTGGRFKLGSSPLEGATVEINDCNINSLTVEERATRDILFHENKSKVSMFITKAAFLREHSPISLYGSLTFSVADGFVLKPEFILPLAITAPQSLEKIRQFWQEKIKITSIWKGLISFSIGLLAYFFVYKPAKSLSQRYFKKQQSDPAKLKRFSNFPQFSARLSSKLNCQVCLKNTVNIIYDCGHLCLCEECYKKVNGEHRCPICNKHCKESIKIFL